MRTLLLFAAVVLAAPGLSPRTSAASPLPVDPAGDSVHIPVLVYHSIAPHHPGQTRSQHELDVDPADFEAQMKLLRQCGVNVISFGTLVDVLNGRAKPPAHSAVITFDDGWENEYRHAFPVLKQLGLTATFFVFTSPIGRASQFLTWEQIREMHDAGMSIESHSRTHPLLSHDVSGLMSELAGSRHDIAEHLGEAPLYFAYPFGNEDARVIAAVQAAGYVAARGFGGGTLNTPKSVWDIRSVEVTDNMKAFRRVLSLSGCLSGSGRAESSVKP